VVAGRFGLHHAFERLDPGFAVWRPDPRLLSLPFSFVVYWDGMFPQKTYVLASWADLWPLIA
jgi:hypothetical protein